MQIVRPKVIAESNLIVSNVPETAPTAYNGGTSYAIGATASLASGTVQTVYESLQAGNIGNAPASSPSHWREIATTYSAWSSSATFALDDRVIVASAHKVYQSLQAGNLNKDPTDPANAAWWVEVGPTNRWAMFDQLNGSVTTRAAEIDVTFTVTGRVNSIGLVNVSGSSAQIIVTTAAAGEVYNETHSLIADRGTSSWYEYFFEPVSRLRDLAITSLPPNSNPTIRVIITDEGGTASIGSLIVGQTRYIGFAVKGAQVSTLDLSRKELDAFGVYGIDERGFSKRMTVRTIVDSSTFNTIYDTLTDLRATPILWIAEPSLTPTVIFGFYRSFVASYEDGEQSHCNLEIEGLT